MCCENHRISLGLGRKILLDISLGLYRKIHKNLIVPLHNRDFEKMN